GHDPPVPMSDAEYIRHLRIWVLAEDCALRVLVPPAVAAREVDSRQEVLNAIARDGRDPVTGQFA
ncbi:diacylglycerol kinase, partial [Escherichia coli]|nr:diacylglycerol kinase [Escherichia coli]